MGEPPVSMRGLVVGIVNTLRGDDGLGPRTVALLDRTGFAGHHVATMAVPQIDITLVSSLAAVDYAVFVDAGVQDSDEDVAVLPCDSPEPDAHLGHTSHALSIPSLLAFTRQLYGRAPNCYLVVLRGYDFSIGERLSPQAEVNLQLAAKNVIDLISAMA